MPPALVNESEDSAPEVVQAKPKRASAKKQIEEELENVAEQNGEDEVAEAIGDEEEEEDDGDGDEDEAYVVEKITDHICDPPGPTLYCVKWQGYEEKKDLTWEPKENLLPGAKKILKDYWAGIGGEPTPASKKRPRSSTNTKADTPEPSKKARLGRKSESDLRAATNGSDSAARRKSAGGRGRPKKEAGSDGNVHDTGIADDWKLPEPNPGAWENDVMSIETIEADDQGVKFAMLKWTAKDEHGRWRSVRAKLSTVYIACPQQMLRFYENHLVFTDKVPEK